ncbi:serine racemase [Cavenderia fasciculata]|uniref:Serine racemase n=1 Tax=Cavenderia fasciculata TaxID=261658 RepID=F4QER4_CACFS|nr:serine racemase [Cavenderia fasciculata]EGG13325.1 serine racemase [Cavenderia fasciculata]|eukprot:XP_004350026.1 serine racemase [Cavenderia fasciculata]
MQAITSVNSSSSNLTIYNSKNLGVSFDDIKQAHDRIKPHIHKTPIMTSSVINDMSGFELYFKCENLQKVGAFKYRGACNSILKLDEQDAKKGVVTHSSGNHGQAIAKAAQLRGIPAYIVVPNNAPKVKLDAIRGYAGESNVVLCQPNLQSRESTCNDLITKTGCTLIHPFDNADVIAGQGTVAIELLSQVDNLDVIICPIGGGGVLSGVCIAAKTLNPDIKIIGVEPLGADDAARSLEAGEALPHLPGKPNTIADGLLTCVGKLNFPIVQSLCDGIITVDDEEIKYALKTIWERMKIIVEPSSATVLAAWCQKDWTHCHWR